MSTHDKDGRPYAKSSEVKAGDLLETDGDFTCIGEKEIVLIQEDEQGLYFACDNGRHFLNGQADDGEHLIGLYKPETV